MIFVILSPGKSESSAMASTANSGNKGASKMSIDHQVCTQKVNKDRRYVYCLCILFFRRRSTKVSRWKLNAPKQERRLPTLSTKSSNLSRTGTWTTKMQFNPETARSRQMFQAYLHHHRLLPTRGEITVTEKIRSVMAPNWVNRLVNWLEFSDFRQKINSLWKRSLRWCLQLIQRLLAVVDLKSSVDSRAAMHLAWNTENRVKHHGQLTLKVK